LNDEFVKSQKVSFFVIPAKAGIQLNQSRSERDWTPAFAGVTAEETFYEAILNDKYESCRPNETKLTGPPPGMLATKKAHTGIPVERVVRAQHVQKE
jgi:hypothetical protein